MQHLINTQHALGNANLVDIAVVCGANSNAGCAVTANFKLAGERAVRADLHIVPINFYTLRKILCR